MWNEEDRKWLYEQMRNNGVDTGSYQEFSKSLENKEDRDWYYQKSLDLGLDVGSANDFAGMMVQPKSAGTGGGVFDAIKGASAKARQQAASRAKSATVSPNTGTSRTTQTGNTASAAQTSQPGQSVFGLARGAMAKVKQQAADAKRKKNEGSFIGRMINQKDEAIAEAQERAKVARHRERENNFLGRAINKVTDSVDEAKRDYTQQQLIDAIGNAKTPEEADMLLGLARGSMAMRQQSNDAHQRMENMRKASRGEVGYRYNPQTGRSERTYYTMTGEEVNSPLTQRRINKAREEEWEATTDEGREEYVSKLLDDYGIDNIEESVWQQATDDYNTAFNARTNGLPAEAGFARASIASVEETKAFDLKKLQDEAWNKLGNRNQQEIIKAIYNKLKKYYPKADDKELANTARTMARQQSDMRMFNYAVEKNMPLNGVDYFLRKVVEGNAFANLMQAGARMQTGSRGDWEAREIAEQQYDKSHKVTGIAGTIVGMSLDPLLYASGGVSSGALKGATWLGGKVAGEAATRAAASTLAGRLTTGMLASAINLGVYESGGEAINQLKWGGYRDPETGEIGDYSAGAIAGRFGHGFVMGAAIGTVAPLLGNVSDKLVRATESTAGKLGIRAGELAVGTVAEGTIFSIPEWIEGKRDAMDVWTDNLAFITGLRGQRALRSAPRVIAELSKVRNPQTMAERNQNRIGFEGRLRQVLDGRRPDLALTKDEKRELERGGYTDLKELTEGAKQFTEQREQNRKQLREAEAQLREATARYTEEQTNSAKKELEQAQVNYDSTKKQFESSDASVGADLPYERFQQLISDTSISEAARAKMYYYLTGRQLPMSTVMGASDVAEVRDANGKVTGYTVQSYGANGVITSRTFSSRKAAEAEQRRIYRQVELNGIDIGEQHNDYVFDQRCMEEACRMVGEKAGVSTNMLFEMMKKRPEELTDAEKKWAELITNVYKGLGKTLTGEDSMYKSSAQHRADVSKEFGVDIDKVIKKEPENRSEKESQALAEYANRLYADLKEQRAQEESQPNGVDSQAMVVYGGVDDGPTRGMSESQRRGYNADERGRRDIAIALSENPDDPEAQAAWAGVQQRIEEEADYMAAQDREVANRLRHADGQFHPVTLSEQDENGMDKQAYLIDGTVNMTADGTMVDASTSDTTVVIYDPLTGGPRQIPPTSIKAMGEVITAEDYDANIERNREQYVQNRMGAAQGVLNVTPGGRVTMPEGDEALVVAIDNTGENVTVLREDGSQVNVTRDELQRVADELALADYRQRHGDGNDVAAQGTDNGGQEPVANGEVVAGVPAEYVAGMEIIVRDDDGTEKPAMVMGMMRMDNGQLIPDPNGRIVEYLMDNEVQHTHIDQLNEKVVGYINAQSTMHNAQSTDNAQFTMDNAQSEMDNVPEPEEVVPEETPVPEPEETPTPEPEETPVPEPEVVDANAMPMVEVNGKLKPDFFSATPERSHEYIYNEKGYSKEIANQFVENNIKAEQDAIKKLDKKEPKMGTDMDEYDEKHAVWQEQKDAAQGRLDYWGQVREIQKAIEQAEKARADAERAARDEETYQQALKDEADYQTEQVAKQQEQEARGANAVGDVIREKWEQAPKIVGFDNEITLANGERITGKYVLVESGAVTPSHDANHEFVKNEGFPVDENGNTVNDRDYERDKDAQEITRNMANNYDGRALQYVPVVTNDGVVLSGNGRTMAGELAAANNTDGAYIERLRKYGRQFGFSPEQVDAMQHPRVVFVPDEALPYTTETFAKFNAQEMKGQNKTEQAVKLGKVVDDATFHRVINSINEFDTLGDFYGNQGASVGAINELRDAGVINAMQYGEMFDGEKLSDTGKNMLENMLIGKAFESNPDAIRQLSKYPSLRQSVVAALAEISNNVGLGAEYSLESELAEAIKLAYEARNAGRKSGEMVSAFARQRKLFEFDNGDTVTDYNNLTILMLADVLNDKRVNQLKKTLALYNRNAAESAAGQMDIFSGSVKQKEDIIKEVLELLNYGTEQEIEQQLADATEQRKQEAGREPGGENESVEQAGTAVAGGESGEGKPVEDVSAAQPPTTETEPATEQGPEATNAMRPADVDAGEQGPKIKGRRQVAKALERARESFAAASEIAESTDVNLLEALQEDSTADKETKQQAQELEKHILDTISHIYTAAENARKGDEGAITDEEAAWIEEIIKGFEDMGYSVSDEMAVGKPYNDGMKVIATFAHNGSLPEGAQVIDSVRKPQINRNGKMVQAAVIHVAQNLPEEEPQAMQPSKQGDQETSKQVGSETLSPSTETLHTTQVETPESPKEGKSEAAPEQRMGGDTAPTAVDGGGEGEVRGEVENKPTTKAGWLSLMNDVYKTLCERYGVPAEPIVFTSNGRRYNFDYSATKGYRLDELESYYNSYKKNLDKAVEPASDKQMSYIEKLADAEEREILKGVKLNKVSASYVISILKASEEASHSPGSSPAEFEGYLNELIKVAELAGKDFKATPVSNQTENEVGYKVGDRVFLDNVEHEVVGINADGSLQLRTNRGGIGVEHTSVSPEKVRRPGSDESVEFYRKAFADNLEQRKISIEECKSLLDNVDRQIDDLADEVKGETVTSSQLEQMARLTGMRQALSERIDNEKPLSMADMKEYNESVNFIEKEKESIVEKFANDPLVIGTVETENTETALESFFDEMLSNYIVDNYTDLKNPNHTAIIKALFGDNNKSKEENAANRRSMVQEIMNRVKERIEYHEGNRAMELFKTIEQGDTFSNDNGLTATIEKVLSNPKKKNSSAVRLKWAWEVKNGQDGRGLEILTPLRLMQWLKANNMKKHEKAGPDKYETSSRNTGTEGARNTGTEGARNTGTGQASKPGADGTSKQTGQETSKQGTKETGREEPKTERTQQEEPKQEKKSKWVDDEDAERFEELRERLRRKLGGQANMGIDPEIFTTGVEMGYLILKHGARKFADFARQMLEALGEGVRPYLKSFYNGARDLPEVSEWEKDLTPYEEVRKFDVANFDKPGAKDLIETAKQVSKEQEKEKEAEVATKKIKEKLQESRRTAKKDVTSQQGSLFGDDDSATMSPTTQTAQAVQTSGTPTARTAQDTQTAQKPAAPIEREQPKRDSNERTDLQPGSTEGGRGGRQPEQNESLGGSSRNEAERTDGRGMGGRDTAYSGADQERSGGISGLHQGEQRISQPKNTNNNYVERGKDYAPKDVDGRIEANIAAIELMQKLADNGQKATPKDMAVLRKFSGWGGLGKAFSPSEHISYRLRKLLGDEAYEQANMSRNSAYYTPGMVIDTMWDIARAMGFNGGNMLEGSAGIGSIIGLMPRDMSARTNIQAVEIDKTSGQILSLLYPDAKVYIQGFEATKIPNGSIDLSITNVPFVTGLRVMDTTGDKDLSQKFHDIHDFCIAKNVRKLREGGIGIFITSSGTLDNSQKLRNWLIAEGNSDVVGAFRLANNTFGGTGATSDIIVVRKRVNGRKSPHAIDVQRVTGVRTAKYKTGETIKEKGKWVPEVKDYSMEYNEYFVEHPEMMGGEMKFGFEQGDTYRPGSKALYPKRGINQNERLKEFVKSIASKDWSDDAALPTQQTEQAPVYEELGEGIKEGSMLIDKNGNLCVASYGRAVPLMSAPKKGENVSEKELIERFHKNKIKGHTKQQCFRDYSALKDTVQAVLEYQTNNADNAGLQPLIDKLNRLYDNFVEKYGHFHAGSGKPLAIGFLRNDMDFSSIAALENMKESNDANGNRVQTYSKGDIFSKRVVEPEAEPKPTNVKDGIITSIYKHGRIDIPYISKQLGKSPEVVKQEIIESGLGFENPLSREVEVSYEYLSGNVREKLRQAQAENENGEYDVNIKALEKVIPMNIPAHLIEFSLGSSWLDPKIYEQYIKDRTDLDVGVSNVGGTWVINEPYYTSKEKNRAMGVTSTKLEKTIMGHELIAAAMQNRTIRVAKTSKLPGGGNETIVDQEATQACATKIDEIRQDFKDWAREKMQSDAEQSKKVEEIYNEQFNNYVPKEIPDEFVPEYFSGATHNIHLRSHQAKAAIRATTQPLMLAHEVGSGKSFTIITTAMEMRRLGTARKPMVVVQNATLAQFVNDAKLLYPNAKILTLEEGDRNAAGRRAFYAKIKYNDWDMIVIPQSAFERIPDSEERQMAYIQDKIAEKMQVLEKMREAGAKSTDTRFAERELEKLQEELSAVSITSATKRKEKDAKKEAVAKQNAEVKAREMLDRQVDDVENFDDMGIDALFIDEAHEYKHLGFATAMQRGVKGVDPSFSKKSQGVFLKTRSVLERTGGKNVVFATGTPISNTAAEIWTFMRYLMPEDEMKSYDIYYFDDFVRNFGNITQMLEFTTSGKFKENNRFAGYVNLPELIRIWFGVADTVRSVEVTSLQKAIPKMEEDKAQDIYLPQTTALRSVMKYVKAQLKKFDNMSGKEKKANSHIPLTMYGIAKAAAVDARLVMSDAPDDPNSKTNEAVRQVLTALEKSASYKGTVSIFADNFQNKASGFNLFEDIKKKLVAAGVPEKQVVVIKSGMDIKKKQDIFDKVNAGDVRVVMGSTFTLGTGVNMQERMYTLIHIDAPNRPMDYTQRNGRIIRQGNLHKEWDIPVRVLRFGVEDSLDVTAYQRLKTKGAIVESIMNGKQLLNNNMENRTMEEDEDVFGDTVAQLSGSEYALLKQQAEREVRKLSSKKKQHEADQVYIHNQKPRLKGLIAASQKRLETAQRGFELVQSVPENPVITINGAQYANADAMTDYIKAYNKKVNEAAERVRKNYMESTEKREMTMSIGGYDFHVTTVITKDMEGTGGNLFSVARRNMSYTCDELGLKDVPVKQGLLRNAVDDIINNVLSGKDFRERIETEQNSIANNEKELATMSEREGKPFAQENELKEAQARLAEYEDKMKAELEAKEAKYAEMDANIDEAKNIELTDEEDGDIVEEPEVEYGGMSLGQVSSVMEGPQEADMMPERKISEMTEREVSSYIIGIRPRYHLRVRGTTFVVHRENELEMYRRIIGDKWYGQVKNAFLNENIFGCFVPDIDYIFIFPQKQRTLKAVEGTWWHENVHVAWQYLDYAGKEEMGLAALEYLRVHNPYHYDMIINGPYTKDEYPEEATARFVQHLVTNNGPGAFLRGEVIEDNEKVGKLAEILRTYYLYGAEETNTRFNQSGSNRGARRGSAVLRPIDKQEVRGNTQGGTPENQGKDGEVWPYSGPGLTSKDSGNGGVSERVRSYNTSDGGEVQFESAKQLSLFGDDAGTGNLFDGLERREEPAVTGFDPKQMSDEELLTEIGNDEESLNSRLSSEEYDRRHLKEYNQAYDAITSQLEENRTTKDQADEMLCDIVRQWRDGHATGERTALKAQFDALNDYYAEKEAEEQARRDEIEDAFSDAIDRTQSPEQTKAIIKLFNEFDRDEISGDEALRRLEDLESATVPPGAQTAQTSGQGDELTNKQGDEETSTVAHVDAATGGAPAVQAEKPKVEKKAKNDPTTIRMRKLVKGETCHVERRYVESKQFDFTGSETIQDENDVAYIFRQLENSTIENVFLVLRDGKGRPTILHVGMGGYAMSLGHIGAGVLAAAALKPKSVVMVHNHPGGTLNASPQDVDLLRQTKKMFGEKVVADGIIIDVTSGKYCVFNERGSRSANRPTSARGEEVAHKVYTFSQAVFDKEWNPETAFQVVVPDDVAKFVSSHRLGEHDKYSLLVINNQRHITGNIFLPWKDLDAVAPEKVAKEIAKYVHQMGGMGCIIYGSGKIAGNVRTLRELLKNQQVTLTDFISVNNGSAQMRGVLEPEVGYNGTDNKPESKREAVEQFRETYNVPIKVYDTPEEVTHSDPAEQERRRNAKGWYDPSTGEIGIVLSNNGDVDDAVASAGHETIGHYGLRELVGEENYNEFLDEVYKHLRDDLKQEVDSKTGRAFMDSLNGSDGSGRSYEQHRRKQVDELFARMAEKPFEEFSEGERSLWQVIKATVRKLLDKFLGSLKLPKWFTIGDNELRYMLWRSAENLKRGKEHPIDLARDIVKRKELGLDGETVYRDDENKELKEIMKDSSLSVDERITAAKLLLSNNHRDNKTMRDDAIMAIGNNLTSLQNDLQRAVFGKRKVTLSGKLLDDARKLSLNDYASDIENTAALQRRYDQATVKRVADLARVLISSGQLNDLSAGEVKRLLSAVKNSVGQNAIEASVQKVMDIMVDNQLKNGEAILHELETIKATKVNAKGVEVQGQLDPVGAQMVKTFRKARGWEKSDIEDAMAEAEQRMGSDDNALAEEAATDYAALSVALEYVENIKNSKVEEHNLREELKQKYAETSREDRAKPAYKQYVAIVEDTIRQNKIDRAQAYIDLVKRLSGKLTESIANAKAFKEAEVQRIREIQHNANSDMEGRPSNEHYRPKFMDKFVNNDFVQGLFAPLATFDQMLRLFGSKSANGEGYLHNRFMRGWVDARQKEIKGVRDKFAILDKKATELFDGKVKNWGQLIRYSGKLPKATVKFWDGGEMKDHELTQGNLMYMYMVNKMLDGKMKLRGMGITDEDMERVEQALDPRIKALADWLQDEFLVETRNEYNETHKRTFGASMAAIEHYFPLKILANARADKPEDLDNPDMSDGISTATGAIIKRKRNGLALDITGADALSVILDHVAEMEHWNAFAEFNRDLNTLRTYRRFRNQVQNMTTIYGSGKRLWKKFNDVCQMAAGTYRPPRAMLDEAAVNFAKGVTAAKVSMRVFTALKQFLSAPAYIPEVRADHILVDLVNPFGAWMWSMKHLPIFNERWRSRVSGDPRLMKSDMDWKLWRSRIMQLASRFGMSPNAFVDALTVSIGAHAMYKTRRGQYKRDGYSKEVAEQKAIQDAEMLYNQTQQSSEGPFLSTMQVDRSWLSVLLTVFRNASMSYQRQLHDALRNLKRNLTPGAYGKEIEFMTKQFVRDGIDEEQAKKAAKRKYGRQLVKDMIRLGVFGYVMQLAWNLGAYLPYLLFGDDGDEKQKMWDDVIAKTYFGSLEGLTGGDVMSEAGRWVVTGEGNPDNMEKDMPITSDAMSILQKFGNNKRAEAVTDIVDLVVQSGIGVNPQSITDAVLAIMDACGDDPELAKEATICVSRILQVPQSQIDKMYFDEIGLSGDEVSKYSPAQLARRYAEYKVKRGRFLMPWQWDDEDRMEKETKKAMKAIKERMKKFDEPAVDDSYEEYEAIYKSVSSQVKAAKEAAKTDYVESAKLWQEIQDDAQSYATYQVFGKLNTQLNKYTKMYLDAQTPEEAELCKKTMVDYKKAMVTALDAKDSDRLAEALEDIEKVMVEFNEKHQAMQPQNK